MKLFLTLLAVVQLQLIDYNKVFSTASASTNYWKHNKAQLGNYEFSRRKIQKFRGMYNKKTMGEPDKKSRMGRSSVGLCKPENFFVYALIIFINNESKNIM